MGGVEFKKYNIKITQKPNQTINVNYKAHTPTPPKSNSTVVSEEICRYDYEVTATGNSGYLPGEITVMKNGVKSSTRDLLDGDLDISISDAIENLNIDLQGRYQRRDSLSEEDIEELTNPKLIALRSAESAFRDGKEATIPKIMINTSNVTDMLNMFSGCQSLKSLDLSNFDTSNVDNMNSMFKDCTNLEILDISNFDTKGLISDPKLDDDGTLRVPAMGKMFKNVPLKYLILNNKEVKFNVYNIGLDKSMDDYYGAGLNINCIILVPKESLEKYKSYPTLKALSSQFDAIENYNITRPGDGTIQVTPIVTIDNSKRIWNYIRQVKIINNMNSPSVTSVEYENVPINYEGTIMANDNFDKIREYIKTYHKTGLIMMETDFRGMRSGYNDGRSAPNPNDSTPFFGLIDKILEKGYLKNAITTNQIKYIDLEISFR